MPLLTLFVLALLIGVSALTPVRAAPVRFAGNGHFYDAITAPQGLTWEGARGAAGGMMSQGQPGHLATVTSVEEDQFIARTFPGAIRDGYWLGGFQLPGILDPSAGWQWVTGEPFGFHNWNASRPGDRPEPNEIWGAGLTDQDENRLHLWFGAGGRWNDLRTMDASPLGFMVEYEADPSPQPPAITGYASASPRGTAILSASPGTAMLITGANLGATGTVLFDGVPLPAAVASWSPTEILLWVPTAPTYPFRGRVIVVANSKRAEGPEFTITPPAPERDGLLANGSFEVPDSSTSTVNWGYTYGLPSGVDLRAYRGHAIPGWRILVGTIDVKQIFWVHAPGQGRQSIDLVGSPGAATIEQTFFTEPGRQYLFSGWVAHNPGVRSARANVFLNREFFVQLHHDAPSTVRSMNWIPFVHVFRATALQTTLRMSDVSGPSIIEGTALDGLNLTVLAN